MRPNAGGWAHRLGQRVPTEWFHSRCVQKIAIILDQVYQEAAHEKRTKTSQSR